MSFKLPELPYKYDALEPYIDEATMRVHHLGHHQGYTNGLNAAIEGTCYENKSIEEILKDIHINDTAIRNNGGGYWNHILYWQIMSPNGGGEPKGELAEAINRDFGSFENFKEQWAKAGAARVGSGWVWLLCNHGKLSICHTPNQDNPLMKFVDCKGKVVLGMDVWEHAYYLKHQNKRGAYINDFFNVINWDEVAKRYANCK
jgi:Fe-Mn family superoxide dismutase